MELIMIIQPVDDKKCMVSVDTGEYGVKPFCIIDIDLFYTNKNNDLWLELNRGHEVVVTVTIESYELEIEE